MEKQMIKTFEEKKETARILRNVFIVAAVVYVGLIIWSLCLQKYVPALFDVVILLMDIGYVYWCKASMSDAELALKYIEYVESRDELIEAISRNHPWISVEDRLPDIAYQSSGESVFVFVHVVNKDTGEEWIELPARYNERIHDWQAHDFTWIGNRNGVVTHWMPIPEVL